MCATKHRIDMKALSFADVKNLGLRPLIPSTYLSSHNYYTEAIAGASKGQAAVSGALAVNVFSNVTDAAIGDGASVTTYASAAGGSWYAQLQSSWVSAWRPSPTPMPFLLAGAVAGAKKAGVGLTNTDIVNFLQNPGYCWQGSTPMPAARAMARSCQPNR